MKDSLAHESLLPNLAEIVEGMSRFPAGSLLKQVRVLADAGCCRGAICLAAVK